MEEDTVAPFRGFDYPYAGFSQLPHEWLDTMLTNIDNIAEMKVILYIFRHTCGFADEHDKWRRLSVDEFQFGRMFEGGTRMDGGTELSESSVRHGLAKAIAHGYVLCKVDERDAARIKKFYKLNLHFWEQV